MTAQEPTVSSVAVPFSARLRDGTREDHERAESSPFITAYLAGRVPIDGYAALQGQLWSIYDALESSAAQLRDDPVVGPFLDPRLDRLPSLDADLRRLVGDDWRQPGPGWRGDRGPCRAHPRARTDVARRLHRPPLHPLSGDLSGGRALGSRARKLYQLDDDGVRFYRFDDIESPEEFKDGYRRLLDAAPWSPGEQARIVDEARTGFRLTGAMFEELDRTVGASVGA